ncbi:MAG: tRNA (adenosine(37)-N6)-threonylcarbamoyltransferase complex dimerization subunit type 1 TsaB [Alphaproteobacteria bacterium]|nr:tRNA (adenosine(37)-N6)-threonylcarbamoyltransferase complex dimerization subunit type 1 TsaB [Alphaproteobacteria bacterium]
MLGLAIDSADRTASAALWTDDVEKRVDGSFAPLVVEALPSEAGKADQLITVIERLLGEHGLGYGDLDVIAVNRGPGSFTGIRSAVALGRGLALAAGLPVLGVTSHQALAAVIGDDGGRHPLMIALDARRGEVYVQSFAADGRAISEIEAKAPVAVADGLGAGCWRLAGSGARLVLEHLSNAADVRPDAADVRPDAADVRPDAADVRPDAADVRLIEVQPIDAAAVAGAAAARLSAGEKPKGGFTLRPLYVRAPDAVPPAPLISTTAASEVPV